MLREKVAVIFLFAFYGCVLSICAVYIHADVCWPDLPRMEVRAGSHQGIFLSHFLPYFFETGSLAEPGAGYFSKPGWPVSLQDLPVSTFPLTNAVLASLLTLILGIGTQVLVLCVASPLFTESLPQNLCN